jgi:putative peptidoglycan lipid II flippase
VASLVFVVPASIALWTVAAAQTLANIAVSVVWIVVASRQMNGLGMRSIARQWLRLLAAAVAAGVPTGVAVWAIGLLGEGRLLNLLNLAVGGCLFVGLFLLVAKLLKIEEVASLVTPILRKLHVVK